MKIVIHAGMPKAGSTALQSRLKKRRPALRRAGILYPTKAMNHNFLLAASVPLNSLPRIFRQHYRDNEALLESDFSAFWDTIVRQVDHVAPKVIVLSGESIWSLDREEARVLRAKLESISTDIDVVCYVRRPSDFYLSAAQQQIKASYTIPKIKSVRYRPRIEALACLGSRLHVHRYDRRDFIEHDICVDFSEKYLGSREFLSALPEDSVENESISAESMAILQEYRLHVHWDKNAQFTADTNHLIRELRALAKNEKPQLLPKVRRLIDQSAADLPWLKENYGIEFDKIDYDSIKKVEPRDVEFINDICVVDEEKKFRILYTLLGQSFGDKAVGELKFRTVFKNKQKAEPN